MITDIHRILMTADTIGGVWTYALELALALQAYRIDVVLATMGDPLSDLQRLAVEKIDNLTLCESNFKLEWMDQPWNDLKAAGEWLLDLETVTRPDVVHLNGFVHGKLAWKSPTLIVGHSCIYSWFAAVKGVDTPCGWKRYAEEVSQGLRNADLVTAPTQAMLSALQRYYGPFRTTKPIPNGRKAEEFQPRTKEPFVLSTGRLWDEAKNVAALERIATRLSWPVYVAGVDEHRHNARTQIGNLRWLGQLSQEYLADWLGRASIFALPARYEPFGLCALEAGLAGCVLVLGDIPSLREVWKDTALFVPPHDERALMHAVNSLVADEAYRRRLADKARSRALEFTSQRMAREYVSVYNELAHNRNRQYTHHPVTLGEEESLPDRLWQPTAADVSSSEARSS